jgi:hypothetical protein
MKRTQGGMLYHHFTWFRWWLPFVIILAAFSVLFVAAASVYGNHHPAVVIIAIAFTLAVLAVVMMPQSFVLTKVEIDFEALRVVKWPGVFSYELKVTDIGTVQIIEGKMLHTTHRGTADIEGTQVKLNRRPIAIDAWTERRAVVVASRSGRPAILLPPGKYPEHLVEIIHQIATLPDTQVTTE